MLTWKDFYVELERRQDQIAKAEHYRLVKHCSNVKDTSRRTYQDSVSPMHFVAAKETK